MSQLELPIQYNRKVVSTEFAIFKPAILTHKDNEWDVKSLKLYHELLAFNHREEPGRTEYYIPYSRIAATSKERNIQKLISKEAERIGATMQSYVFRVDKKKLEEITGEKAPATISPIERIVYHGTNLKVVLTPTFKKLLVAYQQFYLGDMRTIRKFQHKHSINLYWLIISHQWKSNKIETSLEDLKEILGCAGKYESRWDNFRQFILKPVEEEFKGTWAEFSYEPYKEGKKVKGIIFTFRSDAELIRSVLNESPFAFELRLQKFGIEPHVIIDIRDAVRRGEYAEEHVEYVIEETRKRHVIQKIKNPAGYFLKALKENWFEGKITIPIDPPKKLLQQTVAHPSGGPSTMNALTEFDKIQQYWHFSDHQIMQIRNNLTEKDARRKHYGLITLNEPISSAEAYESFKTNFR